VTCGCGRKQRTRRVKEVTESHPHTLRKYSDYDNLKDRVESIKLRRVQVMAAAFAAGCLAFMTGLSSFRSCRRLVARRSARQEQAVRRVYEDMRGSSLL